MMACPFTSMFQTKSNQTVDVQEVWHGTIMVEVVKSNGVFIHKDGGNKI
jgi:hypothetical protein